MSHDPSQEDPADPGDGNDEDGGGGGGAGEGGSGANDPPPDVGWLTVALIGNSTGLMEGLDVDVKRVALAGVDVPETPMTRWAGDARVDLVATSESGEAGAVATVQVDAGEYSQLALEFGDATVWFHPDLEPEPALVPQPFLGIESDFSVPAGEYVTATVRIGVEGSLRVGGEGYEFRPVVTGFAVEDEPGNDLVARGPFQYRSGGSWLPLLGLEPEERDAGSLPDPYQVPHPVWGDKERPPWAEGSLRHVDPAHLEAFVEHFLVELGIRQTQQELMETLESLTPKEDLEEAVDGLLPKEKDPEDLVDEEPSLPESPV